MLSKAELIERCRHYFDNKDVNVMYATVDGNIFYESGMHFAQSHARSNNFSEVIKITRADLKPESKKVESKKVSEPETPKPSENGLDLDALKAEGRKLKIKGFAIMKAETLKRKIDEANGSS